MITARDAYNATKEKLKEMSNRAEACAQDEYDHYLEATTMKAIEKGEMCASYYWPLDLLEDMGCDQVSFRRAITDLFKNLGYSVDYEYRGTELYIRWRWIDCEEEE